MDYSSLLNRIIEDGITAAKRSYANDETKREGAVAGFEACRDKQPSELQDLLANARSATLAARRIPNPTWYWHCRCYELEIEWTCNVVSAVLMNENLPTIVEPTARALLKAAEILGVASALPHVPLRVH